MKHLPKLFALLLAGAAGDIAVATPGRDGFVPLIDLHAMSVLLYVALGAQASAKAIVHLPANTFPSQTTALKDDTRFTAFGGYELARCVSKGIRNARLGLSKFLAPEVPTFEPSHPDSPDQWTLPASVLVATQKPESGEVLSVS